MKLIVLLLAGAFIGANEGEPSDYKSAYQRAQRGDKPLLVFVSAEWCAPCRTMKATTLPQLKQKEAFRDFHFATVDLGKEEELARKLIGKRGIPHLIVFEKKNNKWERRFLRGMQTPATVEAFMAQSESTRMAAAKAETVEK